MLILKSQRVITSRHHSPYYYYYYKQGLNLPHRHFQGAIRDTATPTSDERLRRAELMRLFHNVIIARLQERITGNPPWLAAATTTPGGGREDWQTMHPLKTL